MPDRIYIATIKIAVTAANESEAADAISRAMTEHLQTEGLIMDWKYAEGAGLEITNLAPEDFEKEKFDFTAAK
jgi:hypothetical protein